MSRQISFHPHPVSPLKGEGVIRVSQHREREFLGSFYLPTLLPVIAIGGMIIAEAAGITDTVQKEIR